MATKGGAKNQKWDQVVGSDPPGQQQKPTGAHEQPQHRDGAIDHDRLDLGDRGLPLPVVVKAPNGAQTPWKIHDGGGPKDFCLIPGGDISLGLPGGLRRVALPHGDFVLIFAGNDPHDQDKYRNRDEQHQAEAPLHGKKIGERNKRRHHRRHQVQHGMRDEVVQRSHIIAHELFHIGGLAITKPTKRQHREL